MEDEIICYRNLIRLVEIPSKLRVEGLKQRWGARQHDGESTAMQKNVKRTVVSALVGAMLATSALTPSTVLANTVEERPSALAMFADGLFMRPVMVGATALGAGVFVVTLPFSLLGGNTAEVGEKMVVQPFKATFFRCLGCTRKHEPGKDYYQ